MVTTDTSGASAATVTTTSVTVAALSTEASGSEPMTAETTAVEATSVAVVEETSAPTAEVSSVRSIDFSVVDDGLDFAPSLVRDGGMPGDVGMPGLGERLDTGFANILRDTIDRIETNHPGAEHFASALQSLVDRLDEPDHAVLDWLHVHFGGAHMPDDSPFS